MPSVLTVAIEENENLSAKDYVLRCSKSFGALTHMRNDSIDEPIRLRKLDLTSYDKDIAEAKTKIKYYTDMSVEEVEQLIEEDYQYELKRIKEYSEEDKEILARYKTVLEQVQAWEAPETHQKLKEYALAQLEDSIEWTTKMNKRRAANKEIAEKELKQMIHHEVWRNERLTWATDSLKRAEERKEQAIKAVEKANKWITDLLNSLEDVK